MEEDYGVARAEVIGDGPFDCVCALFAEVDGDAYAAVEGRGSGAGGWGPGRWREAWGGCFDLYRLEVVFRWIHDDGSGGGWC